jgi:spermidine/putrescine transport system substrate-binding protein
MFKKLIVFFCVFLAFFFIFFKKDEKNTTQMINVYNWGSCIAEGVNDEFTRETGIAVNYTTFQSNEEMFAKLMGSGASFDVIFPSDYMVARLVGKGMLAELDFSNIPNYFGIDEKHKRIWSTEQRKYCVPYVWGVVGIFYNEKYVNPPVNWGTLWNEKFKDKILFFDNPRDAFAAALIKLGKNVNSVSEDDWRSAAAELMWQRPFVQGYMSDQVFDKLISEEAWIAPFYCEISFAKNPGNPNVKFVVPSEGTNKFIDCMCIPASSKHKKEAEIYINFMCRPDISIKNSETLGFLSPVKKADEILRKNKDYEHCANTENTQVFDNLPENINLLADKLWMEVKVGGVSSFLEKIVFLTIFFGLLILYLGFLKRKPNKKRVDSRHGQIGPGKN